MAKGKKQDRARAQNAEFRFSPRPNRAAEIGWRGWGEGAFDDSRKQAKPVMLVVSAVWCHWCHVMDETTFSDDAVISLVNKEFIPVRVDSDRRPDINSRYNLSGWPAVSFLTPDGEMIGGSSFTYLPPAEFGQMLANIADYHRNSKQEIATAVEQVTQQRHALEEPLPGEPGPFVIADVLELLGQVYDDEFGGFGGETKFPFAGALSFLLSTLADGYIEKIDEMLRTTLNAMAAGGMYDRTGGGFFRYAAARDWSQPHYEKMLADNGALLGVYSKAALVTADDSYGRVALDVQRYLASSLRQEGGAFGGSQDADEEYYQLDAAGRTGRRAPTVDSTIYADANGAAVSGLLRYWQVIGDPAGRQQGLEALSFVWDHLWDPPAGLSHYWDGAPHLPGLLVDVSHVLPACIDAYESGGGELWLDRALELARWLLDNLEDKEKGGFFDAVNPPAGNGYAAERTRPLVENSQAAGALIRLAQSTGQPRFGDAARRALSAFAGLYENRGIMGSEFARAVQRLLDPPVRVTIAGPPDEAATQEMIRAAHRAVIPFRSVEILDPALHGAELEETGYGYAGKPVAYICIGSSCQAPVFDPAQLPERLEKGRRGH